VQLLDRQSRDRRRNGEGTAMNLAGPSLLVAAAFVFAAPLAGAHDTSATFVNHSSVGIRQIYLSPHGAGAWGMDRLGSQVLQPGDSLQLSGIRCDPSDIKLVDQDDRQCTLREVKLCEKDSVFNLTDTALALCRRQK
jgi:hypothetical protein